MGLFYVVWSPTVPTVPRGRSGAAAGAGRTVAQILSPTVGESGGKGLTHFAATRAHFAFERIAVNKLFTVWSSLQKKSPGTTLDLPVLTQTFRKT